MKQLFAAVLLVVATMTAFKTTAQEVLYAPAVDSATRPIYLVAEAAVPGTFYIFTGLPDGTTQVSIKHQSGVVDTLGSVPFVPTAWVGRGTYLYVGGENINGGDTILFGINQGSNAFWYPDSMPIGVINALTAIPSGVLVGGGFTVTSHANVTYSNFVKLTTANLWNSPGGAHPFGSDHGVTALRTIGDSVYVGFAPNTEDTVYYVRTTLGGTFADTFTTNFKPSAFGPAWSIKDFVKDRNGDLHTMVNVTDTVSRLYLCKGEGKDLESYQYFHRATGVQLINFRKEIWGIINSNQTAMKTNKIVSISGTMVTPRYLNGSGPQNGGIMSSAIVDQGGYVLIIGGSFKYVATSINNLGDTLSNSMAIAVADTTPPVLTLIGDTVTMFVGETYDEQGFTVTDNMDALTEQNVIVTGTVNTSVVGTYVLMYTVADSSNKADTAYRVVHVVDTPTGIWEVTPTLAWNMYPNPTQGQLTITCDEQATAIVTDAAGSVIIRILIEPGMHRETLSVPPGMYLVTLTAGQSTASKRLVVLK